MSLLLDLNTALASIGIPIETGVFSGVPPDAFLVITPLSDTFLIHADNKPQHETQEARLSLFCKGNYQQKKIQIVQALLRADFTITDRRYIGHEDDTGFFHYAIDVAKDYEWEE